jgi:hypothetical protein
VNDSVAKSFEVISPAVSVFHVGVDRCVPQSTLERVAYLHPLMQSIFTVVHDVAEVNYVDLAFVNSEVVRLQVSVDPQRLMKLFNTFQHLNSNIWQSGTPLSLILELCEIVWHWLLKVLHCQISHLLDRSVVDISGQSVVGQAL